MLGFDPEAAVVAYLATMSPEAQARAIAYTREGEWLLLFGWLATLIIAFVIVRTNVLVRIRERVEQGRDRPTLATYLVALAFTGMAFVLTLPWAAFAQWNRHRNYGLSNQTLLEWLAEQAIIGALAMIVLPIFLVLLYRLIWTFRRTWWLWAAPLVAAFMIIGMVISPLYVEPLFNTYKPAPPGPMRDAIVALAEKTGTPHDKIYIYDGSRQSNAYTANVSGLFGSARVALSDTMFKKGADLAEVMAVVGHEMGHYRRDHILWATAIYSIGAALGFLLAAWLFPLFRGLLFAGRVGGIEDPAGLPVLWAVAATLGLLATPINNSISRVMEADADRYSLTWAREPDGMAEALIKTAEYRAPSPARWEEIVFYSHPSVESRIRTAMRWKAANAPAITTPPPAQTADPSLAAEATEPPAKE